MPTGRTSGPKGFQEPRYRRLIEKLISERKAQGLSQQALADRLGRHQQYVSRYEIGERRLDIVEFIDVANGLGCDPAKLISEL